MTYSDVYAYASQEHEQKFPISAYCVRDMDDFFAMYDMGGEL